jgi:outer membrane protein assembly factor BamD (BamD/ComL family)
MSVTGIASSILSTLSGLQKPQNQQNPFLQIRSEFKQLGQDLQAGNLAQAQSDFSTLSQNLSSVLQNNASTTASNANPVVQAFAKLGQDLQSGNLQAAQQDFATIQQDTSQSAAQVSGHHHHHHQVETSSNSSSTQQSSSLAQDFSQLANSLQAGNLSAAQSAFSTLQNDIQQIGGTGVPATAGSVNVSV